MLIDDVESIVVGGRSSWPYVALQTGKIELTKVESDRWYIESTMCHYMVRGIFVLRWIL